MAFFAKELDGFFLIPNAIQFKMHCRRLMQKAQPGMLFCAKVPVCASLINSKIFEERGTLFFKKWVQDCRRNMIESFFPSG